MDSPYSWVLYLQIHLLLKLICNLKINTPGTSVVTCGHMQGGEDSELPGRLSQLRL